MLYDNSLIERGTILSNSVNSRNENKLSILCILAVINESVYCLYVYSVYIYIAINMTMYYQYISLSTSPLFYSTFNKNTLIILCHGSILTLYVSCMYTFRLSFEFLISVSYVFTHICVSIAISDVCHTLPLMPWPELAFFCSKEPNKRSALSSADIHQERSLLDIASNFLMVYCMLQQQSRKLFSPHPSSQYAFHMPKNLQKI